MSAILEPREADESVVASEAANSILQEFDSSCRRFLDWERKVMILGRPTDAQKEHHRLKLRWLMQFARQFLALVEDPACPNEAAAKALNWLLWRLNQSWQTIYNPVPEAEFQRIVSEVFPDNEPSNSHFNRGEGEKAKAAVPAALQTLARQIRRQADQAPEEKPSPRG